MIKVLTNGSLFPLKYLLLVKPENTKWNLSNRNLFSAFFFSGDEKLQGPFSYSYKVLSFDKSREEGIMSLTCDQALYFRRSAKV